MIHKAPKLNKLFFSLMFFLALSLCLDSNVYAGEPFIHDNDIFQISVILDGYDITDALEKGSAIIIDPEKGVIVNVNCTLISEVPVTLDYLKITFRVAGYDLISEKQDLDLILNPDDDVSIFQTWTFGINMSIGGYDLLGGIYEVRYDLHYSIESVDEVLMGVPFYIQISENPISTVAGIASSASVAVAGISVISIVSSMAKSVPLEVTKAIESTLISPSSQLRGTYESNLTKSVQDQVSNAAFSYIKKEGFEKCPNCHTEWQKEKKTCSNCNITLNEAAELCTQDLSNKSMNACKELVDSASALSVSEIALKIGQGVTPTSSIIYVLTYAGFAFTKPRLGKSWSEKTRKLIVRLIETALFVFFWIQAAGIDTISVSMMVIGLLTAAIPGIIISKFLEGMILAKAKLGYKKEG